MQSPHKVLGKRVRRTAWFDQPPMDLPEPLPKRSRARRSERSLEGPSTARGRRPRSRSGLLTPEPSTLTESHIPSDTHDEPSCDTFPFMSLPAELRLHIYHMALVRLFPLNLHADRAPEPVGVPDIQATDPFAFSQPFPGPRALRKNTTPPPPQNSIDPIVPVILRLNKQIYKEARQILYSENVFTLTLTSGVHTLNAMHQRSRSLIKHVVLTIPSHHDILDGFADLVRLGLRYCWGLKSFKIILHASLPDDGRVTGATSVYANAFHILRWLPRGCSVVLEGCVSETVKRVVSEEGRLMSVLDETSYLKRQHQMPERH